MNYSELIRLILVATLEELILCYEDGRAFRRWDDCSRFLEPGEKRRTVRISGYGFVKSRFMPWAKGMTA
jgi:hypothetical protein